MALIRTTTFQGSTISYRAYCDRSTGCARRCRCKQESGHAGSHTCRHS